jgi:competence protein ComGC
MKDKILDKIISFDKLLGITALTIAGVAVFFSVYGIATLFAGAFVATAIMASAIEVGKLVSVTFLYRYWKKCTGFLKIYLSLATLVLMLITSIGIFGYLSAAYQKSAIQYKAEQEKISMIQSQIPFYSNLVAQSESRIKVLSDARIIQEARLSEAMTNAFLSRNPLQLRQLQEQTIGLINKADEDVRTEAAQIRTNQAKIMSITEEANTIRFSVADKKDIRTFQFVAEQFNVPLDDVAKWFILLLIFVFDPLAIALILGYNIAVYKPKIEENTIIPNPEPPKPIIHPALEEPRPNIELGDGEPIPEIKEDNLEQDLVAESPSEQPAEEPAKEEKLAEGMNDPFYRRMFKI